MTTTEVVLLGPEILGLGWRKTCVLKCMISWTDQGESYDFFETIEPHSQIKNQ